MLRTMSLAIIAFHLLVVIVHGWAHGALDVELSRNQLLFASFVITLAPVLAGFLIWKGSYRTGAFLMALSMAGSFIFGFWNHFAVFSPDHVSHVSRQTGIWVSIFIVTAYLLAFVEIAGTVIGSHLFLRNNPNIGNG